MNDQIFNKNDVPRPILILVIGGFFQSVGSSFVWPLNSIFIHNVLGRSLTEAGMLISAQALAILIGQFISGVIVDRFGARKIMIYGIIGSIFPLLMIGMFPTWGVYASCLLLYGFAIAFIFVPINALVFTLWPEGGRRGFNLLYVFNNAGVAVGTATGGFIAALSFKLAFFVNAFTFFIYLLIVLFFLPAEKKKTGSSVAEPKIKESIHKDSGFPALLALGFGVFLMWGAYIQINTVLPVTMSLLGYSFPQYSLLWTLNGIVIVTCQPITNWIIKNWAPTLSRQFFVSCAFYAIGFFILLANLSYSSYFLMMFIITLGEMLVLPGVAAAAALLAPAGKIGTYQGIVAGASSGGRVLGPILGGFVFDHFGGQVNWVIALGLVALALLPFYFYHRWEKLTPQESVLGLDGR